MKKIQQITNEVIQSLNSDFAAIRDKNDLLKIIHLKLKNLFDFTDHYVAVINEDEVTLSSFLQDVNSSTKKHALYEKSVDAKYSLADGIFNKVLITAEPQVFHLQPSKKGYQTEYFQIMQESGVKTVIMIGLKARGRAIGLWCICQLEKQLVSAAHLQLIKNISTQLSIAIDNIQANEAILAREKEAKLLLKLSEDIANIRDKNELFKAINRNLKKLFLFEDIVIMVLNDDHTYYAFLFSLAQQSSGYAYYQKSSLKKYAYSDACFHQAMHSDGIVVMDMEQLYHDRKAPDYIRFEYESGIRGKVAIKLRDGHKDIGVFYVNATSTSSYSKHELALIEGVSYQLSIAVANILASEEIEARETERELLLALTSDMASVRNHEELMQVITRKLKYQLAFSHTVIGLIDNHHSNFRAYILDPGSRCKGHPFYQEALKAKFPIQGEVIEEAYQSSSPVIYDLDELNTRNNMPVYFQMNYDSGIKQVAIIRFSKGEDVFGFWMLFFEKKFKLSKTNLSLITGVANQLSIAVSNIKANEEIKQRVSETTRLLSFSNALASVRIRKELSLAFTKEIKKFDIIQDYSLRIITEDRKHHRMFLYDSNAHFTKHPDFPVIRDTLDDIDDGITNVVMQSHKPVTFNVAELNQRAVVPAYVRFWKNLGLVENRGMPVRLGDETIGILWLRLSPEYNETAGPLLQNICYQIAVALSNILANDKVAKKDEEKTILLSLSNEIASLKNRGDLFKVVNTIIKHILSITQFGITQINEDGITHSAFMMDLGNVVTQQEDFKDVISIKYSISDAAFSRTLASEDPVILDVDALFALREVPLYVKFWKAVGFKQLLSFALRVGGRPIGAIFFNIHPNEINAIKTNLLKGICAQLAVAVSNILANEKVLHQIKEIEQYKQQLEDEKIYLKEEIATQHNYTEIIGESDAIKKIFQLVEKVASSDSTVLLLGETGTGKELIARAIHNNSPRKDTLMVKVNCAALPANLIESELFGHERGSFTGALERRVGKFELANNGTLFLDEVGELPLELQVKLLRVLQEKEVDRIGGKNTIKVDVRIIAATNRDLEKEMNEGRFRSDLYYRLNIFPISLPPLRSRQEDITLLAAHFIEKFSKKTGRQISKINNGALQELERYGWPGNIRELEHLVERSILLSSGDTIKRFELPSQRKEEAVKSSGNEMLLKTIDENERDHILNMLKYCKGRISGEGGAAEILGVPKSTLNSKIKRLGIKREHTKT